MDNAVQTTVVQGDGSGVVVVFDHLMIAVDVVDSGHVGRVAGGGQSYGADGDTPAFPHKPRPPVWKPSHASQYMYKIRRRRWRRQRRRRRRRRRLETSTSESLMPVINLHLNNNKNQICLQSNILRLYLCLYKTL